MLIYILKSSACLAIFMLFYKLFVERLSIHHTKRIYLLAVIVLSFSIPLITFTEYVEVNPQPIEITEFEPIINDTIVETEPEKPLSSYIPQVLMTIYLLGVVFFISRFILNLTHLVRRIKNNVTHKTQTSIHVLLKELISPHTFFRYIFFNKAAYESGEISREIYLHENTHAKELHSIDILIIELLQVVLWFNPLIYLIKRDIKLNHEFLADSAVLNNGVSPAEYQNLLLTISTSNSSHSLANPINYSSFKKRFTVMKAKTSKTRIWLSTLMFLPIIAILFYSFISIEYVPKEKELITVASSDGATPEMMKEYRDWMERFKRTTMIHSPTYDRIVAIYSLMDDNQRNSVEKYPEIPKLNLSNVSKRFPTTDMFESWKNAETYALWLDGKPIKNKELNNLIPSDIHYYSGSKVMNNARSEKYPQPYQFHLYTEEGFTATYQESQLNKYNKVAAKYTMAISEYLKGSRNDNSELKILYTKAINIYNSFSKDDLKKHKILMPPPVPAQYSNTQKKFNTLNGNYQDGASKVEIEEYNKLASHYNEMPRNNMVIKSEDVERLSFIYNKMTEAQRRQAEPMPDFPEPPPAPDAPLMEKVKHLIGDPPPPPPTPNPPMTKKSKSNDIGIHDVPPPPPPPKFKQTGVDGVSEDLPSPPPPPKPKDPIEHIKSMGDEGAIFYLEGKEITIDQAIDFVNTNNKINIQTRDVNSQQPKVFLSRKPIYTDKKDN